jgi:heme oxygenase
MSVGPQDASLRERLRRETRDLHDRLEAAVDAERQLGARADYARYLRRLWRLHRSAEDDLCRRDFTAFGFSYATRRRSPLLEADLAALGCPLTARGQRDLVTLPRLANPAAALGSVYVIEGSALGARVLLGQITAALGLNGGHGAAFFAGRPSEDRQMWRSVVAALNGIDPSSPEADAAIAGARAMFTLFLTELPEPEPIGIFATTREGLPSA